VTVELTDWLNIPILFTTCTDLGADVTYGAITATDTVPTTKEINDA
jgi:hypothetical protein